MKAVAALNVYKRVALVRRETDSLAYEDADGSVKTVTDLGQAASTAVSTIVLSFVAAVTVVLIWSKDRR